MVWGLIASLFFTNPAPLEMPKAEAYLVKEGEVMRLEDRYDTLDLWTSQTVLGRWEDDDGRSFIVAKIDTVAPKFAEAKITREEYLKRKVPIFTRRKGSGSATSSAELSLRDDAIEKLMPFDLPGESERTGPKQRIRGMKDVLYLEGTNRSDVVCTFLPEEFKDWYFVDWTLLDGDDFDWAKECFEKQFLSKWSEIVESELPSETIPRSDSGSKDAFVSNSERELLRADAHHSVTNYQSWHWTDSAEFTVLDDLPAVFRFIPTLTNDLATMRRRYAEVMPSPIDGSNVLAVARIFGDRDEYLDAAGEDMSWSAAYWNPERRELVAYFPEGGETELVKTIRHEAFHQYLSYATSMVSAAPWINEGYAQYFEDENSDDWQLAQAGDFDLEKLSTLIPGVLGMDYERFYAGTDLSRRIKYRLAWSIAFFLEKGAPTIRFEPFKNLKRDYIVALLEYRSMSAATVAAFGSRDRIDLFVSEWLKFWKNR